MEAMCHWVVKWGVNRVDDMFLLHHDVFRRLLRSHLIEEQFSFTGYGIRKRCRSQHLGYHWLLSGMTWYRPITTGTESRNLTSSENKYLTWDGPAWSQDRLPAGYGLQQHKPFLLFTCVFFPSLYFFLLSKAWLSTTRIVFVADLSTQPWQRRQRKYLLP